MSGRDAQGPIGRSVLSLPTVSRDEFVAKKRARLSLIERLGASRSSGEGAFEGPGRTLAAVRLLAEVDLELSEES